MLKIVTDSASDLLPEFVREHDIGVVPFSVTADGEKYLKDGIDINASEFYKMQRETKHFFKTSLPSMQDYLDEFNKHPGIDILCFCLSSKFSGSYQSAVNAAREAMEDGSRKVVVVDTLSASMGYGIKIMDAVELRAQGKGAEEIAAAVMQEPSSICLTVDTLEYLQRGGRIGKVSAFAGSLLNIKPIIQLVDGELTPHSRVRGRKRALSTLEEIFEKETGGAYSQYRVGILHSDCHDEADEFVRHINTKYGVEAFLQELGLVIGVHIGPSLIAMLFAKK